MEGNVRSFNLEERLLDLLRVGRDRWARRITFAAGPAAEACALDAVPHYL